MSETTVLHSHADQRFVEMLTCHRGILNKVTTMYAYSREDRADLSQEITTELWRAFPGYDRSRPFSTWIYRIALNVAISDLRKQRRRAASVPLHEQHEFIDPNPRDAEHELRIQALHRFISALEPLERALMLLYLEECPQRQIADILGISESNVSTKINRIKQRIHKEL
jgi:RNA polymerase sigma factor (sigma-70 family)